MPIHVRTPETPSAYDQPLNRKRRAVAISQGVVNDIAMVLRDDTGTPIDFSGSESSESSSPGEMTVKCRFREASLRSANYVEDDAVVTNAAAGEVTVTVPSEVSTDAGFYLADFGLFDADAQLRATDELLLFVQPSAWATTTVVGPPSLDTIRQSLRDSDLAENELIETFAYDLPDICAAAIETINFWNEALPPIAFHTTISFPFRNIWLTGIQLFLFQAAEEHYRRNKLPYSAGGTNVDDKNRDAAYKAAWQERYQQFSQMVKGQKVRINVSRGYRGFLSGYPRS